MAPFRLRRSASTGTYEKAGPGDLDGRIQRQQAGLLGDARDHLDRVADLDDLGGAASSVVIPTIEFSAPDGTVARLFAVA
jgi:hypothetical protein